MATSFHQKAPTNASDAYFRLWGSAISAAFAAVGLVQTADTGQINWTTVTAPAGATTYQGYEIWRFDDGALQTSNPVYFRIDYGSGSSTTYPAVKIVVGHATDGAGNLTGTVSSDAVVLCGSASTTAYDCYVSGDGGRINVLLYVGASTSYCCGFYIERLKNDDGTPNADGVNIVRFSSFNGAPYFQQMLPASGSAYPATPHTSAMCAAPPAGYGTYGANIGLYPIYPNIGYAANPDMGGLAYFTNDIASGGTMVVVTMYGTSRTFVTGGVVYTAISINGNTGDWAVAVRYE
jgi:hypothetical protein